MPFQSVMNYEPAPGLEGGWCSANYRASLVSGPGALVAGPAGVTIGRFAWADNSGQVRNSGGVGRIGFVHRDQIVLIQNWLGRTSNVVPPGYEITLQATADVWARFAAGATIGQKVYANYADGTAYSAAPNSPPVGGTATGSIAAGSASFTASIAPTSSFDFNEPGATLNVTAVSSGTIQPGGTVSGAGVVSGQTIVSQISGTPGGVGLYELSTGQTLGSVSMTEAYGVFTAASALTGGFAVGDPLSGGTVAAGTNITALGTGTGGLGTYIVNNPAVVASATISAAGAVETVWYVNSACLPGELAMISPRI